MIRRESESVSEDRGGQGTEEEVLDGALRGPRVRPAQGDQHVGWNADQLDGEEQNQQVVGRGRQQYPKQRQQHHRHVLAVLLVDGLVPTDQYEHHADPQREPADVMRERVDQDAWKHLGRRACVRQRERCAKGGEDRGHSQRADQRSGYGARQAGQHHDARADEQDPLRSKLLRDVRNRHGRTSAVSKSCPSTTESTPVFIPPTAGRDGAIAASSCSVGIAKV